ncbi:alpha/beta hydrolase [Thiohalocapsa marina]|uniref:alpha/beta hydrolase n=1 Tax=Thiohalocapsa marina TaxID=424902 RepID=UPI001B86443B|nr:alpha/beta hydrolase [Thiohalocapsa marina]
MLILLVLLLTLVAGGCSGLLHSEAGESPGPMLPDGVVMTAGTLPSSTGCLIDYRLFHAASASRRSRASEPDELVILAHGFLRNQARMHDLASAIAAAGAPVVTMDLCNMRPWDGGHVENARDLQALARSLSGSRADPLAERRIVYAGFSAGGLAALMAARNDPRAVGVLTLDLVDANGLGMAAAEGLNRPLLGLAGEPTNCNAWDNGRAVFAASRNARLHRVPGAGHCDFESPTDLLCEIVCQQPEADETGDLTASIIASATQAVLALLDGDPTAWTLPDQSSASRLSALLR